MAVIFRSDLAVADPRAALAVALILVSPMASALTSVGIKKWGHDLHPYTLTTLPMAYGAVGLLAIGLAFEDPREIEWSAAAIGSLAYLALFGSVTAFVIYYRILKFVPVSLLALITCVPDRGRRPRWLVLDERLSGTTLVGASGVLAGIVLATLAPPRRERSAIPPATRPGRRAPT